MSFKLYYEFYYLIITELILVGFFFFLIMDHFPCFFACLMIFDGLPEIVKFTFLCARYFFISYKYFSGAELSNLEILLILLGLFFELC